MKGLTEKRDLISKINVTVNLIYMELLEPKPDYEYIKQKIMIIETTAKEYLK